MAIFLHILLYSLLQTSVSFAFPAHLLKRDDILSTLLTDASDLLATVGDDLDKALQALDPFGATPVDVFGEHAFVAPSSTDQRGPCPALNALYDS
jgi:hypothetical protein